MQSLSSILEHMEEYLKPIIPQFTFPESRYLHVISSEGSRVQGAGGSHLPAAVTS